MDKNIIKKALTVLKEEAKAKGLTDTEKVKGESDKINKAAQKDIAKEMKAYEEPLKPEGEPVKYENDEDQQEYVDLANHQQGSIMTPESANDPGEDWEEKNRQAVTGENSIQGNSNEYANVIPEDQAGFTGKDANQKIYDNNKKFKKKAEEADIDNKFDNNTTSVSGKNTIKSKKLEENKKSKMKRLVFKNEFKGIENALNVIPESYKVDGKEFHMTDGNEKYEIKWEGNLTEGRAVVLKASDKNLMTEDMQKMKHLMGYSSKETLGTVKGAARLDEDARFDDVLNKTKNLLGENAVSGGMQGFAEGGDLEKTQVSEYGMDPDGLDVSPSGRAEIDFSRGLDIDVTVVSDGKEIDSQTFNKDTHQIEELLDYLNYNENSGYDVYL